jgi:hypothetical protein
MEHAPHCSASKLGRLLQHIIRVYAREGFQVQTILMDNEFEKVANHVINVVMNTPAGSEHITEIEPQTGVPKERAHDILCTLPYPNLPQQILIQLLPFIVM